MRIPFVKVASYTLILFALVFLALLFLAPHADRGHEINFYALRNFSQDPLIKKDLAKHHQVINRIIAQSYFVRADGSLGGEIGTNDQALAKRYGLKFMLMITNTDYDSTKITAFLNDKAAQQKMIRELLSVCDQHKPEGVQIDFEHMPADERAHFNEFYRQVAQTLHQHHYKVSVAIIPVAYPNTKAPFQSLRQRGWSSVFDPAFLEKYSDFVTVMAYDQHVENSPPGPIASIPWNQAILKQLAPLIPKNKLSFGIPVYSGVWRAHAIPFCKKGSSIILTMQTQLSYRRAKQLVVEHKPTIFWDDQGKVNFTLYPVDGLYQYLFFENKRSFRYKVQLVKMNRLRGISIFGLGQEDPQIWSLLKRSTWED